MEKKMRQTENVKTAAKGSDVTKKGEECESPLANPLKSPCFSAFVCRGFDLRDFLNCMDGDLAGDEEEIRAWIGLCALALLSFPAGQINYSDEKEIAGLLMVKENVLISTIEKAQARKEVLVLDRARMINYGGGHEYKILIFLDKLFPDNRDLKPELLPEEVPISQREFVEIPRYRRLYFGPTDAEEMGLSLWNENPEILKRRVLSIKRMLWTEYVNSPFIRLRPPLSEEMEF
jgi:hypothetical protein